MWGTTLKKIADPDEIEVLNVDRSTLPPGDYQAIGYESRQVFDIDIRRIVTEYRAEILQDQHGLTHENNKWTGNRQHFANRLF